MDFITKPICSLYLQHLSLEIEDTELTSAATWNSLWILRSLMHSSWWAEWLSICDFGNKYRLPTEEQSSSRGSNKLQFSLWLLVLPHVSCYGVGDLHTPLVLSIIFHKLPVGSHKVHDDGVVDLGTTRGGVQGAALSWQQDKAGHYSRCSRCLRPLVPDCNKLCRIGKPPRSEPLSPSGRSALGKTLQEQIVQLINWKQEGDGLE